MGHSIILASASPRRVELLRNLGVSFSTMPSDADESFATHLEPEEIVMELALRKAETIAKSLEDRQDIPYIIAADTIVVADREILNKPSDPADAVQMLTRLSGRQHQVFTGVCLLHGEREDVQVECSQVFFRDLSPAEINYYVATKEPMDKAGAYAVQGIGAFMVARIEGCITNIIGLPVVRTLQMLRAAGLKVME